MFNQGRVVDFMTLGIGPLRTGIFNLADVAVMAGAVGFVFSPFVRLAKQIIPLKMVPV